MKEVKRLNSSSAPRTSKSTIPTQRKAPAKQTSGFSFLSLEASMNDKTLEVFRNSEFVCIRDKFPKSRIHLLLIPLPVDGKKLLKVEQLIQLPDPIRILSQMQTVASQVITENLKLQKEIDFKIGKSRRV